MTLLTTLLKLTFSFGILGYLLHNNLLNFSILLQSFKNPTYLIACNTLLALNTALGAWRWQIILNTQQNERKISFFLALKLTWIGLFFNMALPGAISGDVLKYYYIKKEKSDTNKSYLISTLILDRISGLTGLIVITCISILIGYESLTKLSPIVTSLINSVLMLGLILTICTTLLVLPLFQTQNVSSLAGKLPFIGKNISTFLVEIFLLTSNPNRILGCLGISILTQAMNLIAFWVLTSPFYDTPTSLSQIFVFVPMGLLTTVIPIAPAGFGVGHAAFGYLFSLLSSSRGASYFNLYFFSVVLNNIIGVVPYILLKSKNGNLLIQREKAVE